MKIRFCAMLLMVLMLLACSGNPDEAALRARIDSMIAALEEREPRSFMQGVGADFVGDHDLDHAGLQAMLRAQLLRNAKIGVSVISTDVTLHGERATVVQRIVLSGGEGGLIPDRYRQLRVESGWRVQGGEWQVYVARWEGG